VALYLFAYSIFYFFSTLPITDTASIVLHFGYTLMMVIILFVVTGESKVFFFSALLLCDYTNRAT